MNSAGRKTLFGVGGSLVGLAAIAAIIVAVNLILSPLRARLDLTEERLYTLSRGTKAVLAKLQSPVTLKFFFNESDPQVPVPLKNFARNVEDLLREYEIAGKGRISVERYDPKPDSDAEEWANRYGLARQGLGLMGPSLYLGVVAVCGEEKAAIPFIDPRTENLLEYNVSRLVWRVANPKRRVVGVLSSLPVLGRRALPFAMPDRQRQGSSPPWLAFKELKGDYDVREIQTTAESIDPDVDVLVVVHPKDLSEKTLFAIDQFVMKGGRLVAFTDPMCLADLQTAESNPMMMMQPRASSDLNRLTRAWGISFDSTRLVADMEASTRVRRSANDWEDSPVFLSLRNGPDGQRIDPADAATSDLNYLMMPMAGCFTDEGGKGLSVTPLVTSSTESDMADLMSAQLGAEAVRRHFKSGMKRLTLALRVQGVFPSAFPDGIEDSPAAPPAGDEDKKDEKPEPKRITGLTNSVESATVVLVGDADMLYDQFAVQELEFFGHRAYQPINDNIIFFGNLIEQMAGSADLINVRSRGKRDRSFDRVRALERAAQERWRSEEERLQRELDETVRRLEALRSEKDQSQRVILSLEQKQEIARFRRKQAEVEAELKKVRRNLREGIERLGYWVKAINILLMPLAVAAAGLLFWLNRRRKTRTA